MGYKCKIHRHQYWGPGIILIFCNAYKNSAITVWKTGLCKPIPTPWTCPSLIIECDKNYFRIYKVQNKKLGENPSTKQVQNIWRKWKELAENKIIRTFIMCILYQTLFIWSNRETEVVGKCAAHSEDHECVKQACFSETWQMLSI